MDPGISRTIFSISAGFDFNFGFGIEFNLFTWTKWTFELFWPEHREALLRSISYYL